LFSSHILRCRNQMLLWSSVRSLDEIAARIQDVFSSFTETFSCLSVLLSVNVRMDFI
jgi:hypothetical protein